MTDNTGQAIGMKVQLNTTFEEAIEIVTAALKEEGFGVLTEIDVKATLKKKIDVDFRPYMILGACNPPLAHQALSKEADVGMLLPCNVTVSQIDDETIEVAALNPMVMMSVFPDGSLNSVAEDAHARLRRVIDSLK